MMDASISKLVSNDAGVIVGGLVFSIGAIGFFAGFNNHTHVQETVKAKK